MIFNYNGSEHFNVYPGSYQGVRPDTLSELREGATPGLNYDQDFNKRQKQMDFEMLFFSKKEKR